MFSESIKGGGGGDFPRLLAHPRVSLWSCLWRSAACWQYQQQVALLVLKTTHLVSNIQWLRGQSWGSLSPSKKVDSRKPMGRRLGQTSKFVDISSTQVTQLCRVLWWVGNSELSQSRKRGTEVTPCGEQRGAFR